MADTARQDLLNAAGKMIDHPDAYVRDFAEDILDWCKGPKKTPEDVDNRSAQSTDGGAIGADPSSRNPPDTNDVFHESFVRRSGRNGDSKGFADLISH